MQADSETVARVNQVVKEYVNELKDDRSAPFLAEIINSGHGDLLQIVETLGEYLTSSAVEIRTRATLLLSNTLTHVHQNTMPQEDVQYLTKFFCDRLKDKISVHPAILVGLETMLGWQRLQAEDEVAIAQSIFSEVHNQSLCYMDRRRVYVIMAQLLKSETRGIHKLGSEFVLGYIQVVDGEKDPRNLLLVFKSVLFIIHQLSFDVLAEDLFEVVACYFPIHFSMPPDEDCSVTKEELVSSLRACLTATDKFAEFCLPILAEKLSSDLPSAQVDSLLTLTQGAKVFSPQQLVQSLNIFWVPIRNKILYPTSSEELQTAALECLEALSSALSAWQVPVGASQPHHLDTLVSTCFNDLQRHLCQLNSNVVLASARLLGAVARGSDPACAAVLSKTVPPLVEQCGSQLVDPVVAQEDTSHRQRRGRRGVAALLELMEAADNKSWAEVPNPLAKMSESLYGVFYPTLWAEDSELKCLGLSGISKVAQFLSDKEVSLCVQRILAISSDTSKYSCTALKSLADSHSKLVAETILPGLLDSLSTDSVDAVVSLSTQSHTAATTLQALLGHLSSLSTAGVDLSGTEGLATAAGEVLVGVYSQGDEAVKFYLYQQVIPQVLLLYRNIFANAQTLSALRSINRLVKYLADLLRRVAQTLNFQQASGLLSDLLQSCLQDASGAVEQVELVALFTAVVVGVVPEVVWSHASLLLPLLFKLGCHCTCSPSQLQAAKGYCAVINKLQADGVHMKSVLDDDMTVLREILSCGSHAAKHRALSLWMWLTKALVVRSHPSARKAVMQVVDLLKDRDVGLEAANGFQLLLSDCSDLLTALDHANVKLMYKQKFYEEVVPVLREGIASVQSETRQNYLVAIMHTLQAVPAQVRVEELPSLFPLIMELLECGSGSVKVSAVEQMEELVTAAPLLVGSHLPTLVSELLALALPPSPLKLRKESLVCVGKLASLPYHVVYPYKHRVVESLGVCLDDKKRLVRSEAVKSRDKWFSL